MSARGISLLVVDDEPSVRRLLRTTIPAGQKS
jgi:CheY-like chemotaxis protein